MKAEFVDIHKELIERCKTGDIKSQMEVYKLYYKSMFNVSLRILNNRFEAEDIMQESFLSAFSNLKSFDMYVTFGSWLKRIVINKSIDCIRKRKINFEQIDEGAIEDEQVSDNEAQLIEIKVEKIKECLLKLKDPYRLVFSLYVIEGYDHQEISQILKINESTSRAQLTRAKHKLRQMVNEKCPYFEN